MAKERTDKPRKDKAEKPEKKVSKDKIKKSKKEKKAKREESLDGSVNEPSKLEDTPAVVDELAPEASATASASTPKPDKKTKKADKKGKKSKKATLEALVAEDASNTVNLPAQPVSKGYDADVDEADSEAPLFAIDTNPTPVDPTSLAERADAMDEDKDEDEEGPKSTTKPPSGLNRIARRRIRLIEERREKIQKNLGVPIGSREKADEVQAILDGWVADYDDKAAIRMEKKRLRKAKEAARIKSKRGKLLSGRRLTERKKQLDKMEKKAKKKGGISANAQA
ncbi:hypothetical protein F4677DRAFT_446714 [Hypoxylon crocopeplum]|nr:hypothetical protein F4677DRAFT_446714 [Hypoxylon crocopeplum]